MKSTKQSIVVVTDVFGQKAGAYRASLLLCRELARLDFDVTCFATWIEHESPDHEPFRVKGPVVSRGYRWDLPHRSLALQAARHIQRLDPLQVFVVGITRLSRYLLKSSVADRLLLWELTNGEGNKFVDERASRLLHRSRGVLAPSQTVEDSLRQTYDYPGPVERLPFWVEDESLSYQPPPEEFLADFLFLGRREDEKGLRELIEATGIIKRNHPAVRVVIGGFGDETPYRNLARRLDLAENLSFSAFETRAHVMEALASSRYLVLPSHHEGYPLVLLEAIQQSVPVIASGVGSIPEVFGQSGCCLITLPREPRNLAEAMNRAMGLDDSAYQTMRQHAHHLFHRISSEPAVQQRIREVITQFSPANNAPPGIASPDKTEATSPVEC